MKCIFSAALCPVQRLRRRERAIERLKSIERDEETANCTLVKNFKDLHVTNSQLIFIDHHILEVKFDFVLTTGLRGSFRAAIRGRWAETEDRTVLRTEF